MSRSHLTIGVCAALLLGACPSYDSSAGMGSFCASDDQCGSPFVCVFGGCYDPSSAALQRIAIEVAPASSSGLPVQQFGDFAISSQSRSEILLSPLIRAYCFVQDDQGQAQPALIVADAPSLIPGRPLRVDAVSGGNGQAVLGLSSGTSYELRVLPQDDSHVPFEPPPLYANDNVDGLQNAQTLTSPDPSQLIRLSGRAVISTQVPRGIQNLRVQVRALVGSRPERQVVSNTVLTASSQERRGHFEVLLPARYNSDLQLRILPTPSNPYYPVVEVDHIDLAGDSDLGDIEIGDVGLPFAVQGMLTGPAGPVAGASVVFSGQVGQGSYVASTATGVDGRFQLDLLAGDYRVLATPPVSSTAGMTQISEPLPLGTGEGQLREVDIQAQPRAHLRGQLRDSQGQAVTRAIIRATRVSSAPESPSGLADKQRSVFETRSDLDGAFDVRVDPGLYELELIPSDEDLIPRSTEIITMGLIDQSHDLTLRNGAPFGARILRSDTSDLAVGALVRAFFVLEDGRTVLAGEAMTDDRGDFAMILPHFGSTASVVP